MSRFITAIFFLCFACSIQSQSLGGTWRGRLTQGPGGCFPIYFIEMQLRVEGLKVYGSSYHFSDVTNFVKENFEGVYDPSAIFNEIKVDTGNLRLDFYDNAEIDGDTISVSVDNQITVSHQRLSAKAVTVSIRIDFIKTEHEVIMIAENEGSIPPNTALLIVTAGEKRYRLFLSSDVDQKKVLVRFIYENPATAAGLQNQKTSN